MKSIGCGREIVNTGLFVHPSVRPFVSFNINLNISFIYKNIFIKFARNVYGYENLSLQNFGLILKNHMATIANCLKIISCSKSRNIPASFIIFAQKIYG